MRRNGRRPGGSSPRWDAGYGGGGNRGEDLNLERRNALLNMIDLLQERGYTRNQAYVICSVAVALKVSNVVDVPNYVVSVFLPEVLFDE